MSTVASSSSKRKEAPADAAASEMSDAVVAAGEEQQAPKRAKLTEVAHEEQKASDTASLGETRLVVVDAKSSALATIAGPPVDNLFCSPGDKRKTLEQFREAYYAFLPLAKRGLAKVRNPDLAMALACTALKLNVGVLDLDVDNFDVFFQVSRAQNKYINFYSKTGQKDFSGKKLMGYTFVTSAFVPAYAFKYGATESTGVNGNQGKTMECDTGTVETKPGEESYECTVGVAPIHSEMKDAKANNPMALDFMTAMVRIMDLAWAAIWKNPQNFVQRRAQLANLGLVPKDAEEGLLMLRKINAYKDKLKQSESDSSAYTLAMKASCYRHPAKQYGVEVEDHAAYAPPSLMFADQYRTEKTDPKTKQKSVDIKLVNELPVWRWRRPDEVEEGKKYASPWILIPRDNVRLTRDDAIHTLFSLAFYDNSARNECGFKYVPVGYVWLNTKDALDKLDLAEIEPCNPLVANAYAGVYRGPLDDAKAVEDAIGGPMCASDFE